MTGLRTGAIGERHYKGIALQTGMVKSGPASRVIDLEDDALLTDVVIEWAHMIDGDLMVAMMSALRDCDDRIRRVNITDAFIRKFFEYSAACGVSEEAWLHKVDRKLREK